MMTNRELDGGTTDTTASEASPLTRTATVAAIGICGLALVMIWILVVTTPHYDRNDDWVWGLAFWASIGSTLAALAIKRAWLRLGLAIVIAVFWFIVLGFWLAFREDSDGSFTWLAVVISISLAALSMLVWLPSRTANRADGR